MTRSPKSFSELDDYAIDINTIKNYDKDLKRFLAFNPHHNSRINKDKNLGFTEEEINEFDREIIETDRSGWRGYHRMYSKYLSKFRDDNITLLEIGIEHGWGLLAWQRYFKNAKIIGLEKRKAYQNEYVNIKEKYPEAKNIDFNIGRSHRSHVLEGFFKKEMFDVIIDDGAHNPQIQTETLITAWPYLKSGGLYFIEDIKHDHILSTDWIQNLIDAIKERKHFQIYRHVNVEKAEFLKLSEWEQWKIMYPKIKEELPNASEKKLEKLTDQRILLETSNPHNYSVVIEKKDD